MTNNKKNAPLIITDGRIVSRGRPKLETEEKKSHIIQMRVSGDEREWINSEAQKAGKSVSEWLRGKVLG